MSVVRFTALLAASAAALLGLPGPALAAAAHHAPRPVSRTAPRMVSAPALLRSWVTTPDQASLLAPQPATPWSGAAALPIVRIDDTQRFQTMAGFGASLTQSSAVALGTLPAAARGALLGELFSSQSGIGLSYLRQPLGASDFASSSYTYDDVPAGQSDSSLSHFSLGPDATGTLPLLRAIKTINPRLGVMLTPWSAPAWLKDTQSTNGGTLRAGMAPTYASYLARSVAAYTAAGVRPDALTLQNEPEFSTAAYPSMALTPAQESELATATKTALAGQGTALVGYDHNWDDAAYPAALLGSTNALSGTAYHCYGGSAQTQSSVHAQFPQKDVYQTECSGGDWAPSFASNLAWDSQNLLLGAVQNWSKTVMTWNLALDEHAGPQNGGCSNCRGVVTINSRTHAVTRNVEYYVLAHAAKFVRPGATRIASSALPGLSTVAFQNPDGSHVLVAFNAGSSAQSFALAAGTRYAPATLPAGALATYTW